MTTNGNIHDITGGTRPGNGTNLFHSFGEFSVDRPDTARFLNTTPELLTSNILGRVTGGDPSSIFGTIDTLSYGNANLFLMNPAGFLFGPNATVNVGGMVAFTSADYLRLGELGGSNAGIFHADPTQASVLTSVPVAAFGFLGSNPGAITVQGSQFTVTEGRSISLVGGNVTIQSGALPDESIQPAYLVAPGGRIHLASVASAGEIIVNTLQTAPNIEGQSFSQFGTTSISEGSTLEVNGESSGTVRIRSGQFVMDNSFLFAGSFGEVDGAGNAVSIDGTDDVLIGNQSMIDATSFGTGRTGDIEIQANNLSLTEGSIIEAQGFGGASAGNISLTVENTFSISGTDSFGNGGLITTSGPGTGTGGAVTVKASNMGIADQGTIRTEGGAEFAGEVALEVQSLTLSTGASIQAFGGDFGPSGKIKIMATESISLNGNGDFSTRILSQNVGSGGTGMIAIEVGTLALSNSSQILSETAVNPGGAEVPKLSITADSVSVSEGSRIDITTLQGDVGALEISARSVTLADRGLIRSTTSSAGNAGSINITADNMALSGGSQINSSTEGINVTGRGGDISLTMTNKLALAGSFTDESGMVTPTAIQSSTQFDSLGDAGQISIAAGTLDISNGALIASRSASGAAGDAGSITIEGLASPAESVLIDGPGSGLFTDTQGTGAGGDIFVNANSVTLQNGGMLSAKTSGTEATATGGTVTVEANQVQLNSNAFIIASTSGHGNAGNINLTGKENITLNNSRINSGVDLSTATGDGGTVQLTGSTIALQNSRIRVATSGPGNAGNIDVAADNLSLSENSSLQARTTSGGNAGNITIHGLTGPESTAQSVALTDSLILSDTFGDSESFPLNLEGSAGNISITAGQLLFDSSGVTTAAIDSSGTAGNITIKATEGLTISQSSLTSNSEDFSLGDAGKITVASPNVIIQNGGLISTSTDFIGKGGTIMVDASNTLTMNGASITASSTGTADAGNIDITATNGFTMQNSKITTLAGQGASGGNIKVTTTPEATVLLTNSLISASVADGPGGGGNISIDPQYVILQNSQILATAQGQGGAITITANLFLPDANSIVSADSGSGLHGTVTIQSPNAPASGKIQPLGATPLLATSLLNQRCAALAGGEFSSFTVAGRDSLPTEPGSWLASPLATLNAGMGLGVKAEGVRPMVRNEEPEGETAFLSMRQIAPVGFLTQAFAVDRSAGCKS